MKTIKFSHNYPKLQGQTEAELIAVKPITINDDTPELLIEYDTFIGYEFINDQDKHYLIERQYYPLKPGNYIQLIFLGNLRIPFCTIRSAFPSSKIEYYQKAVGETFRIEVKNENRRMHTNNVGKIL